MAFVVVATILVGGPRIWTVGEALANLSRSLTSPRATQVERPAAEPAVSVEQAMAVAPLASPARVEAPPAPKPAAKPSEQAPAAKPPRPRRSRPAAAPAPAKPAPAAEVRPAASPGAARLQHFYSLMDQGVRLYRAGWFGPSAGRFRQAVAVMPTSPYAYLWLGRASLAAQRPADAREALERVIALAPDSQAAREAAILLKQLASGNN